MKFNAGKLGSVTYSPELSGANTRQAMNREFVKIQRIVSELSNELRKLNQRIVALEAKHEE
jgi:hypothetical protein